MKTQTSSTKTKCSRCNIGTFSRELTQFSVDIDGKWILIEDVPGSVCSACGRKEYDKSTSDELIRLGCEVLSKSRCHTLIGKFNDFIRPEDETKRFETLDIVQIKDDANTWDFYDEEVVPGLQGTVTKKGEMPFDYVVEFRRGRGRQNVLEVEIDEKDLILIKRFASQ